MVSSMLKLGSTQRLHSLAHRSLDSDGCRADFSSLSMRAVNSVVKRFDRLRLIYSEFSGEVFACVDLSLVSTLSH